jgi:hypothetical protein
MDTCCIAFDDVSINDKSLLLCQMSIRKACLYVNKILSQNVLVIVIYFGLKESIS